MVGRAPGSFERSPRLRSTVPTKSGSACLGGGTDRLDHAYLRTVSVSFDLELAHEAGDQDETESAVAGISAGIPPAAGICDLDRAGLGFAPGANGDRLERAG